MQMLGVSLLIIEVHMCVYEFVCIFVYIDFIAHKSGTPPCADFQSINQSYVIHACYLYVISVYFITAIKAVHPPSGVLN